MTAFRILPHRTVREDRVVWGAWWRITEHGTREPLAGRLESWDYAQTIRLACHVQIDINGTLSDAGLSTDAALAFVATWDCPAALDRGVAVERLACPTDETWAGELVLNVPPGAVAQELLLERHLVLHTPTHNRASYAPHSGGARLGPSTRDRLVLEGTGSRFPVEATDFASAGYERAAAWTLEMDFESSADSFLGAVRLLVNAAHPAGQALLANPDSSLLSVLRYDLIRKLLMRAVEDREEFRKTEDLDEGSVGGVLADLCSNILHLDLETALSKIRADPVRFDTLLQSRTGFLGDHSDRS